MSSHRPETDRPRKNYWSEDTDDVPRQLAWVLPLIAILLAYSLWQGYSNPIYSAPEHQPAPVTIPTGR